MVRMAERLNDRAVKAAKGPAVLIDGKGLRLVIDAAQAKRWRFRYSFGGREREMGLGVYPDVSLAEARATADNARAVLRSKRDPLATVEPAVIPTFGEAADAYVEAMQGQWHNAKHRAQWAMTLTRYAAPIRDVKVNTIDTAAVLKVLEPIWQAKPETASRLRGRIERVLAAETVRGHRSGPNPALWRGHLSELLAKRHQLTRGHHRALAYDVMPAFLEALRDRDATSARALEFAIFTAARSGEVRGMTWAEVDLDAKLWTVPASRMKAGREHRVPLPERAAEILKEFRPLSNEDSNFVFPGQRMGKPLSVMALTMVLRRMNIEATVHGFRSTFRDWAGEVSPFPTNLAEEALAHVIKDKTEAAYARGDMLAKRRPMMEAWAAWCAPRKGAGVVPFRKGA